MQTQLIANNLKELHKELKKAAEKHGEQAKSKIRTALAHLEAAKTDLRAQVSDGDGKRKAQAEKALIKLEEIGTNGKNALENTGAQLHSHLKQMIASAKSALDVKSSS